MIKTLAIFCFSIGLVQAVSGQACPGKATGKLMATVYDFETKAPLYRAAVKIAELKLGAITTEATRGKATIVNIEAGTYTVEATFPGYEKHTITGIPIGPRATPDLRIWMNRKVLPECMVQYAPTEEQRKHTVAKQAPASRLIIAYEETNSKAHVIEQAVTQPDLVTMQELNSGQEKNATVVHTLEVFPNPATGLTQLRFHAEPGELATIRLSNSKGDIIQQQVFEPSFVGNHVVPLDLSELPSGDYFVHMVVRDRSLMRRLTVIK